MGFRDWMSGRAQIRGGLWIGQHLPPPIGHGIARLFAGGITRWKPDVYWIVRRNLRHVLGPAVPDIEIHRLAWQVFYHAGQTYYDFFRLVGQPTEVLCHAVQMADAFIDLVRSEMAAGRGVLLLGVHMSNFDLSLLTFSARGVPALVLSLGEERTGFELINEMRESKNMDVRALGAESLRAAIAQLKSGGTVITGADRPVPDERDMVEFFGQPACLPLGPARLALMTEASVIIGSTHWHPEQGYLFEYTGPIEMVHTGSRRQDMLASTRRLAEVMESYIRLRPAQWMMFHPLWPDQVGARS